MAKSQLYSVLNLKGLFSTKGRINRMAFIVNSGIFLILVQIFSVVTELTYSLYANILGAKAATRPLSIVLMTAAILIFYIYACAFIKRLHDIGVSAFLFLFLAIVDLACWIATFDILTPYVPNVLSQYAIPAAYYLLGFNIIIAFGLKLVPGQNKENRHGPKPGPYFGGKTSVPKLNIPEG